MDRDTNRLVQLTTAQLLALAIAVVCEISRRFGITLTARVAIGEEPQVEHVRMEAGMLPTASTGRDPGTPCPHTCTVAGCIHWCSAQGQHELHWCRYHRWY